MFTSVAILERSIDMCRSGTSNYALLRARGAKKRHNQEAQSRGRWWLCSVGETYRTAALWSEVWQWWNRTSLRALVNAYLPDMVTLGRMYSGSVEQINQPESSHSRLTMPRPDEDGQFAPFA